jgi:hypothetical protein
MWNKAFIDMRDTSNVERFIRRILVVSNAIQTIENEIINLIISFIIYCLNCIRRDRNSTYKTGVSFKYRTKHCAIDMCHISILSI